MSKFDAMRDDAALMGHDKDYPDIDDPGDPDGCQICGELLPLHEVSDCDPSVGYHGKLNICQPCIDKHAHNQPCGSCG